MLMTPRLRKIMLTAHITFSVGWIGAVAAFFSLAVSGLIGRAPATIRAAYIAMDMITWFVIVPFAAAVLLTGVISSIGTAWGLFRHYWVLLKLLITVLATGVLVIHLQPIEVLAENAAQGAAFNEALQDPQILMVVASGVALITLLVLTVLSVYKPRGLTPYGARRQYEQRALS
jgi:hypothetical protein